MEYDDAGMSLKKSPEVELKAGGRKYTLTWHNTLLRTFGDTQFDHVEFRDAKGRLRGLRVPPAVMDTLFEAGFPYHYSPYIDSETFEWFVALISKDLDKELAEGGG